MTGLTQSRSNLRIDQTPLLRRSGTSSEWLRSQFRTGPLFVLKTSIDRSRMLADGRLVRSKRLARLEAALVMSRGAVPARKLASLAGLVDGKEAVQLIELLNRSYDQTQSAFRIEQTATGFLMMTRPELVTWLDRLHQRQSEMRLSQPMMETLTIIAYQQPVTRVGVEAIRGVQSSEMIRQLIDRGLVKVGGEDDSLGRPFLYITTRAFLDMFGLGRIEDLPDYDSLGRSREDQNDKGHFEPLSVSGSDSDSANGRDHAVRPEDDSETDQQAA